MAKTKKTTAGPGTPDKNSAGHLDFLDHLRGVAILFVLLCHTRGESVGNVPVPWHGWFTDFSHYNLTAICLYPLSLGQEGVAIFFAVSGFCIHLSFHQQGQKWGAFFTRRFFRIYPAYLAALIFFILLLTFRHFAWSFHTWEIVDQLGIHLLLAHNLDPRAVGYFNGSYWSLAVEAQLYLLYPALLLLAGRLGWRRALWLLAGCEIVIRVAYGLLSFPDSTGGALNYLSWTLTNSPLGYWFSWALGAWVADAWLKKQPLPFATAQPLRWTALAVACFFIKPLQPLCFLVCALVTAMIIARRLRSGNRPPVSLAWLTQAGLWSYSLYLLHQPLLSIYYNAIDNTLGLEHLTGLPRFLVLTSTWIIIIPLAILWYKVFELPGIALGRRLLPKTDAAKIDARPRHQNLARKPKTNNWRRPALLIVTLAGLIASAFVAQSKFGPLSPGESNIRAWNLATNPDPALRDGRRAVRLAEEACARTGNKNPAMLSTLAAAYAEAGRFDQAIAAAQAANVVAASLGQTNIIEVNLALLELYQQHQAYHQQKQ